MKNLLKMSDLSPAELTHILDVADQLKADCKAGRTAPLLAGKSVALLFSKASTRTRTSFEVGVYQLGGLGNYMNAATELQSGRGEPLKDTARVLGRMFDGIEYRGYGQAIVEELAKYASVPVWNGLTNEYHPTQILADFLTLREHFGKLQGLKFAYMGDARYNMGNSLMIGCAKMGLHFVACAPKAYWPDPALVEKCKEFARVSGGSITLSEDTDAVAGADVVYTDVWVSMGEPVEVWEERINALSPYQVNAELMAKAKGTAVFMHCLPATRGEDVTDEVADSDASLCWEEAGNRLTAMRGLLVYFTRCRHEPSGLQIAAAKEELDKVLCDKLGCTEAYCGVSKVKES